MAQFDLAGARAAGYTDAEIGSYLAQSGRQPAEVSGLLGGQVENAAAPASAHSDTSFGQISAPPYGIVEKAKQLNGSSMPVMGSPIMSPGDVIPQSKVDLAVSAAAPLVAKGVQQLAKPPVEQFMKTFLTSEEGAQKIPHWFPGMKLADISPDLQIPQQGDKRLVDDVGRYLESRVATKLGPVAPDATPKVKLNRVVKLGRAELEDQLAKGATESGVNWYSDDTQLADSHLAKVFPELATDPDKHIIQKAISAAMSNNSNPMQEAETGARIWDIYRQTGRIPLMQPSGAHWPAQGAYDQLAKIQGMLDTLGEKGMADFLQRPQTVKDIKQFRAGQEGKAADVVPGSLALGPKIGRYMLDLMGIPQEGSTVDKWDVRGNMRRLGRMFDARGNMIESPSPESDRQIFMDSHAQLGDEFGLSRNQAQSGLWHYEQDLYRRLGMNTKSFKRSDGTVKFLQSKGITPSEE